MNQFAELSIIIVIGASLAAIFKYLKQPLIISYILTGVIVGRSGLDLLTSHETLGLLSEFGIALLLFIIGLGLNPKVIKDVGKIATITGIGQVLFTAIVGFAICTMIGFGAEQSFFISMALTLSSTVIVLKVISDKKDSQRLYAKITTGILLIQDVVATGLLIMLAAMGNQGFKPAQLGLTLLSSLAVALVLFFIGFKLLPKISKFTSDDQEFLFIFTIAWGLGFAALFHFIGLSVEVGALFAGVAMSNLNYTTEVMSRLRPLRDFFLMIFFVMLGAEIDINNVISILPVTIVLSLFVLVGNPLIVLIMMGLFGYTKRTAFKTALTVAQISEFSLVFIILAGEVGIVNSQIVSVVTLIGVITIVLSTYLMKYDDLIYEKIEKYLSLFERKKVKLEKAPLKSADVILFGYARGGHEIVSALRKKKLKFMVIDYDPESIDLLENSNTPYEYGDATDPEFLSEIGIEEAKVIISTVTDYRTNEFLTLHTRARNPRAIIIVHSEKPEEAVRLYERGATYVMMPHYIGTERISKMLTKNSLRKADFIPSREKHLRYVERHLEI